MGITAAEAARILGCSRNHVYRLARQGRLPRDGEPNAWARYDLETVEALSLVQLSRYGGGHPYWATTGEAAAILGVSVERVRQLVTAGRHDLELVTTEHPTPAMPHRGHARTHGRRGGSGEPRRFL